MVKDYFSIVGEHIPLTFISNLAGERGNITGNYSSDMVMYMGISNTAARPLVGLIVWKFPAVHPTLLLGSSLLLIGSVTGFIRFFMNVKELTAYAVLFGILIGKL